MVELAVGLPPVPSRSVLVLVAVDVCTAFYIDGHDSESCGWAGISRMASGILGVFLFSASFISLVGLGKSW